MPEGTQRCSRTRMVLPLRVWMHEQPGEASAALLAHTLDISHIGCRLGGLRELPFPGQTISLQRGQHKAAFRVIWSNQLAANENQAGIEAMDYGRDIWGVELPPSRFSPKAPAPAPTATPAAKSKTVRRPAPVRWHWEFSAALMCVGLLSAVVGYQALYGVADLKIQPRLPSPPTSEELAALTPKPQVSLLAKTLDSSVPRVQVAETPMGHVVYPVAPDAGVRGKVRLQIVIAANGVVKQIRALSGKQMLAEAAARAVRFWRYSELGSDEELAERETTVTVNFVGSDAVSLEFPRSNIEVHAN